MAGKAPKTISILAADELAALPEFQELVAKGHVVDTFTRFHESLGVHVDLNAYDLIMSKSCCMYSPGMEKFLADAIKGARQRKYGPTQLSLEV